MSSEDHFNDEELQRYFNDPEYRRKLSQQKKGETPRGGGSGTYDGSAPGKSDAGSTAAGTTAGSSRRNSTGTSWIAGIFARIGIGSARGPGRSGGSGSPGGPEAGAPGKGGDSGGGGLTWGRMLTLLGMILLAGLIGLSIFFFYLFQGLPSVDELENPRTDVASVVMSRDGETLDRFFTENRHYIDYQDISPHVIDALIATEDHRYYNHWGMDMYRTLAIPFHYISSGSLQGASTISQQLARNLYDQIGRDITLTRKFREIITAIQIERNYTKREIIEMYLNTVEFSNSSFGIERAAITHFNKSASELDVLESATLIGTLKAIFAYNPRLREERSRQRRNVVLGQMAKHEFISEEEFQEFRHQPLEIDYNPPFRTGRQSRYFGEYVRQQVQDWAEENGYDLYTDGLVIHTTIDSRLQRHAEQALETKVDSIQGEYEAEWTSDEPGAERMDKYWEEYEGFLDQFLRETSRYNEMVQNTDMDGDAILDTLKTDDAFVDSVKQERTRLEGGFVAIDPRDGNIRAWVGGTDYGQIQRDNVYQTRRQTGSTFKPFVYAVAVDNGYRPYHRFSKYPVSFFDEGGERWQPRDPVLPAGPDQVSLREGLARSLNNVTVRLLPELAGAYDTNRLEDLYPAGVMIAEMARDLGINRSPLAPLPSIALGTAQSTLLELTSAYATFANQGVHIEPMAITRIEDKEGNVLAEFNTESREEVISPESAYIMIDMMRTTITGGMDAGREFHGTGQRLRWEYQVNQDVAGKTGTTPNSADNWFVAMMPHLVTGAWLGGEDRRVRFPEGTDVGQGARAALPLVGEFIRRASNDPNIEWSTDSFEPPPGLVLDPPEEEDRDEERRRISW